MNLYDFALKSIVGVVTSFFFLVLLAFTFQMQLGFGWFVAILCSGLVSGLVLRGLKVRISDLFYASIEGVLLAIGVTVILALVYSLNLFSTAYTPAVYVSIVVVTIAPGINLKRDINSRVVF